MALYQTSVLKKYLASQDAEAVNAAYATYADYFLNKDIQQNIRNSKEEQFQEGFLRELFVNVLGYTINPNPDFNLTTELKNIKDAKKTDGAILRADGAAIAVIELKGTDTKDLAKVNEQAFNYKNNQPECIYVITSNFEKLRFFMHNVTEHQEFNLFTLTSEEFALLWLFLQKDNLLGGIPAKVKEESLLQEDKITKALYADYSAFKNDLWEDMVQRNPQHDPLLLYKKSQKLLDRFLFIFFSEDKGLLPPNSISVIIAQWQKLKDLDEYKPLYNRFKKYFGYMNDGYKGAKYEIHAYNGGLFQADPLLDGLLVDDELLKKHALKLTNYDFADEVDTNILGHIFEHSLNDIENVRAQLAGEEVDKSKTKRKKDGVFYTPKYITKYIVDNTVGKLCEEKKAELKIDDEEFAKDRKGRKKATIKKLDAQLKQYREWLLQLTICDPACGSGAFLNQALEFLMAEHRYVDELEAQLFDGAIVFQNVENHILENNIYGVDINEESVEIARLSLWLRTAQKGRKLTSLSSNIKTGNSLIDDPEVAGDLAFNWQREFPQVFQEKHKTAWHITTATHDSRTSQRMIDHKVRLKRDGGTNPKASPIWLEEADEILIAEKIAEVVKKDKLNILAFNICGDHMHLLLVCEPDEMTKIVGKLKSITGRAYNIEKGITIPATTAATAATRGHDPLPSDTHDTATTTHDATASTRGHDSLPADTHDTTPTTYDATASTRGHDPLPTHDPLPSDTHDTTPTTHDATASTRGHAPLPTHDSLPTHALWTQKFGKNEITSSEQLHNTINYIENNRVKHELPKSPALQKIIANICCDMDQAFKAEYKGGFDVVIGNPPYVDIKGLESHIVDYLFKNFQSANNRVNLYTSFIEQSIGLLNINGRLSFIIPSSILTQSSYKDLRVLLLDETTLQDIVRLPNESFGASAGEVKVDTIILTFKSSTTINETTRVLVYKGFDRISEIGGYNADIEFKINPFKWRDEGESIFRINSDSEIDNLLRKCEDKTESLIDCADFCLGLTPYDKYRGHSSEQIKNRVFHSETQKDSTFRKLLAGNDIRRYSVDWGGKEWISYGPWLGASRESRFFSEKRILIKQIIDWSDKRIWAALTDEELYNTQNAFNLLAKDGFLPEYLIALINSNLISFYHRKQFLEEFKDRFQKILIKDAKLFPIKVLSIEKQQVYVDLVESLINNTKVFFEFEANFLTYLQSQYPIEKPSKKLQNWHELKFGDFIGELNKAIKKSGGEKLSKLAEMEWMEVFETKKAEAQALQSEIDKIDKEIDQMVYGLYGLTEEEIKIVEGH